MNTDSKSSRALLQLHAQAQQWLKRSRVEEELAMRTQLRILESEVVCESDDDKREETERNIGELRDLLDHRDRHLTEAYADLIFAYGLARVGAQTESASLEAAAAPMFKTDDLVHQFVFCAFAYRIDQARKGVTSRGPLPPELLPKPSAHAERDIAGQEVRYKLDRLRQAVQILEPAEEVNPFRHFLRSGSRLDRTIRSLYELNDPKKLEHRIRKLLGKCKRVESKLSVLRSALDLFPRLSPSFSRSVLEMTQGLLGDLPRVGDLRKRVQEQRESYQSFEQLDHLSAAYDEAQAAHDKEFRDLSNLHERISVMEIVARCAADGADAALLRKVTRHLIHIIEAQGGEDIFHVIPVLAGRCLQCLQRLGLREDLPQFLPTLSAFIHCQPGLEIRRTQDDEKRSQSLLFLLNVASGWLFLGRRDLAAPIIDEARDYLLSAMPNRHPMIVTNLACRYVAALALFPDEAALKGLDELFPGIGPLIDTFSTRSHFSKVRLQIIDSVVRAVVHLAYPEDDVDAYLAVSLN